MDQCPAWMRILVDAAVALGTVVLAVVAVLQDKIRSWVSHPSFSVCVSTDGPSCTWVPFSDGQTGQIIGDSVYVRMWIVNSGNTAARNVEVYLSALCRKVGEDWKPVTSFLPMNLKWSHLGTIYFPLIARDMGKHCDLGHIAEPRIRPIIGEVNPALAIPDDVASFAFDVMAAPNNKTHIVGPGTYRLGLVIAAENARPHRLTIRHRRLRSLVRESQ